MCKLCDDNGGEMPGCPNCGRLVCCDIEREDDVCSPPGVTGGGDLMCLRCAREMDAEEEREAQEEGEYYPDPMEEAALPPTPRSANEQH